MVINEFLTDIKHYLNLLTPSTNPLINFVLDFLSKS